MAQNDWFSMVFGLFVESPWPLVEDLLAQRLQLRARLLHQGRARHEEGLEAQSGGHLPPTLRLYKLQGPMSTYSFTSTKTHIYNSFYICVCVIMIMYLYDM